MDRTFHAMATPCDAVRTKRLSYYVPTIDSFHLQKYYIFTIWQTNKLHLFDNEQKK